MRLLKILSEGDYAQAEQNASKRVTMIVDKVLETFPEKFDGRDKLVLRVAISELFPEILDLMEDGQEEGEEQAISKITLVYSERTGQVNNGRVKYKNDQIEGAGQAVSLRELDTLINDITGGYIEYPEQMPTSDEEVSDLMNSLKEKGIELDYYEHEKY